MLPQMSNDTKHPTSEFEKSKIDNFDWVNTAKSFAFRTTSLAQNIIGSSRTQNKREFLVAQKSHPVLLLETIGGNTMKSLISMFYLIFFIAIVFGMFEKTLVTKYDEFSQQIVINDKNNKNLKSTWENKIRLNLGNRFFKLFGIIRENGYKKTFKPIHFNFNIDFKIYKTNGSKTEENKIALKEQERKELQNDVYFKWEKRERNKILFLSEGKSPFGYYWQDSIFEDDKNHNLLSSIIMDTKINLLNTNWNPKESVPISILIVLQKENEAYSNIKLYLEIALISITLVCFVAYFCFLKFALRVVAEQKLVIMLFVSAVSFQGAIILFSMPFRIGRISLAANRYIFMTCGSLLQTFSAILFACFVLLMADTVHRSSTDYSLRELMTSTKISLATTNACSSILSTVIYTTWELSQKTQSKSATVYLVYSFCFATNLATSMAIFLWSLTMFLMAYRELQYWNYNATRLRQLSFRFFVTLFWFVALYFSFLWLFSFVSGHRLFGSKRSPLTALSTNILFTSYLLACASLHLPQWKESSVRYSVHSNDYEDSGFSLTVARLMCSLSWQVYGLPKTKEGRKNGFQIDVEWLKMNLRKIGNCEKFDVQWMLAENENIVTVAFRGSISLSNVSTNLRIYHSVVNNNFWYTGDIRFVEPSQARMRNGSTLVHKGFMQAYMAVRKELIRNLRAVLKEKKTDIVIYLTGHSLGAALATLLSLELVCRFAYNIRIYTFGSPRVGSNSFSQLFKDVVGKNASFRIVFEGDIVASYPTEYASYKHIDSEVYIDRGGNIIFSPLFAEHLLMPSRTRLDQHTLIFYKNAIDVACAQMGVPSQNQVNTSLFAQKNKEINFADGDDGI